jgi:hypothetical protein
MAIGPVALTCIADRRLRIVCTILLRHRGYRVLEADTVEEADALLTSQSISLLVGGALADPEDKLGQFARGTAIRHVRLAPNLPIESLLQLFPTAPD